MTLTNREREEQELRESYSEAGIIPEAIETVVDVVRWTKDNPCETPKPYGHSIGMLGQIIASQEGRDRTSQTEDLREKAEYLIRKYGDHIIEFMRPELRKALGRDETDTENP